MGIDPFKHLKAVIAALAKDPSRSGILTPRAGHTIQNSIPDATGNTRSVLTRVVSVDVANDLLTVDPEVGATIGAKIFLYQFNQYASDIGPLESNF